MFGASRFVYVIIPDGHAVCKIGVAESLPGRLSELQCGAWAKLRCFAAAAVLDGNALLLEQAVHRHLKKSGVHLVGEWFELSGQKAIEAIVQVARSRGDKITSLRQLIEAERQANFHRVKALEDDRRAALRRKLGMD